MSGYPCQPVSFTTMFNDVMACGKCGHSPNSLEVMRPMSEWDNRDEVVLLMVDYSNDGDHPLDDALIALTIGHNNDHNVGEGEGQGWQFAGWSWCQDHYTEGKGVPIGWAPLPHHLARAAEEVSHPASFPKSPAMTNNPLVEALRILNSFRAPKSETWDYQESGFAAGWLQCEELWRAEISRVRASLASAEEREQIEDTDWEGLKRIAVRFAAYFEKNKAFHDNRTQSDEEESK